MICVKKRLFVHALCGVLAVSSAALVSAQVGAGGSGGAGGTGGGGSTGAGGSGGSGTIHSHGFKITTTKTGTDEVTIPVRLPNGTITQDTYDMDWATGIITKNGQSAPFGTQWGWPTCNWTGMTGGSGHASSNGTVTYKFEWEGGGTAPTSIWVLCGSGASAYASGETGHSVSGSNGLDDDFIQDGLGGGSSSGKHLKQVSISPVNGVPTGTISISNNFYGNASGSYGYVEGLVGSSSRPDTRSLSFMINGGIPKKKQIGTDPTELERTVTATNLDPSASTTTYFPGLSIVQSVQPGWTFTPYHLTYWNALPVDPVFNVSTPVDITGSVRIGYHMPDHIFDSSLYPGNPTVTGTDKGTVSGSFSWTMDEATSSDATASLLSDSKSTTLYTNVGGSLACSDQVVTNHRNHYIINVGSNTPIIKHSYELDMTCADPGKFKGDVTWNDGLKGKVEISVLHGPCLVEVGTPNGYPGGYSSFEHYPGYGTVGVTVPWNSSDTYTGKKLKLKDTLSIKGLSATIGVLALLEVELPVMAMVMSGLEVIDYIGDLLADDISVNVNRNATYFTIVAEAGMIPDSGSIRTWWSMKRMYATKVKTPVEDTYGPLGFESREIAYHDTPNPGTYYELYWYSDSDQSGKGYGAN